MSELAGLPEAIGRYRVVGLLGRGGMGRVVRARDEQLQRDVAVKLVEASVLDAADEREARFIFHREARALALLKHPNIIEVYEYSGPEASLPFIVCELVEAPTLRDVLDDGGVVLEARVAAALAYELALALEHAHAKGIIHRDVKPENVFWSASGRIVLADFGIAKALCDARFASTLQFGSTNLYGSPSYMAPEQVRGGKVDERTDLHALGSLLFEVLSGAPPYVGGSVDELLGRVERGEHEAVERDIGPPGLVTLIEEMLAPSPSDRPGSASVVAGRLREALDELGVRDPRSVLVRGELGEFSRPTAGGDWNDVDPTLLTLSTRHAVDSDATSLSTRHALESDATSLGTRHAHDFDATSLGTRHAHDPDATSLSTRYAADPEATHAIVSPTSSGAVNKADARADATRLVPLPRQRGPQNWLVVAVGLALLLVASLTAWLSVKPEPAARLVAVTLVLPGEADLTIDGLPEGPVRDVQHVMLSPGRHVVEARMYAGGNVIRREIYVVRGSSGAQFEL